MNDKQKETQGKLTANQILVIAAIAVMICFGAMIHLLLGVGIAVGVFGAYLALKVDLFSAQIGKASDKGPSLFVDKVVLEENFNIPKNLPIPYAVLNMRGSVLMYNTKFIELFETVEHAAPAMDAFMRQRGDEERTPVSVGERYFEGEILPCEILEESGAIGTVLTLTMVDVTELRATKMELDQQEVAVATIVLDNYDEVTDTLEESRLPILTALIERKMNQWALDVAGMLKKLEKDRYMLLVTKGNLEKLKERRFDILSEIKEINVGEHIPVTMSIGIGLDKTSLEGASASAKAALDLALGRGGDQVLIKEGEKFLFYGGKSGGVERNSRIRARVKADALCDLMENASSILVMGHKNADLDSLGSCIGISAIARGLDKKCHIILNHISTGVRRLCENMKEEGAYEGLLISTGEALKLMDEKTLVIIMDTHRSSMVESLPVLEAAKRVVIFDHHRKSTDAIEQAVLTYHEPYASSASELVIEMIQHIGKKIKLKTLEADALLAGITVDTKNFFIKAGAITFESAGFLRRNGADSIRVRKLFQNDMHAYQARAEAVRDAELFMDGFAISVSPSNIEESTVIAAQAADELMNVIGIKASFVCCMVNGVVNISARSLGDINVQRIMERLGGGGHLSVAGAQLEGITIEQAKEKIQQAIKEHLEEDA